MKNHILAKLFGNTERSVVNWREEKRPIIALIEKHFTEEDILAFLRNGEDSIASDGGTLGGRLQILRKEHNCSQSDFAAFGNIEPRTYTRYETNERVPDAIFFQNLCKEIKVDLNWLIYGCVSG